MPGYLVPETHGRSVRATSLRIGDGGASADTTLPMTIASAATSQDLIRLHRQPHSAVSSISRAADPRR
jgi:hypothetical protein